MLLRGRASQPYIPDFHVNISVSATAGLGSLRQIFLLEWLKAFECKIRPGPLLVATHGWSAGQAGGSECGLSSRLLGDRIFLAQGKMEMGSPLFRKQEKAFPLLPRAFSPLSWCVLFANVVLPRVQGFLRGQIQTLTGAWGRVCVCVCGGVAPCDSVPWLWAQPYPPWWRWQCSLGWDQEEPAAQNSREAAGEEALREPRV